MDPKLKMLFGVLILGLVVGIIVLLVLYFKQEPQTCKSSQDCPSGQTCVNGKCQSPPPVTTCSSNSDCTGAMQFCDPTSKQCKSFALNPNKEGPCVLQKDATNSGKPGLDPSKYALETDLSYQPSLQECAGAAYASPSCGPSSYFGMGQYGYCRCSKDYPSGLTTTGDLTNCHFSPDKTVTTCNVNKPDLDNVQSAQCYATSVFQNSA